MREKVHSKRLPIPNFKQINIYINTQALTLSHNRENQIAMALQYKGCQVVWLCLYRLMGLSTFTPNKLLLEFPKVGGMPYVDAKAKPVLVAT